MIDPIVSPPSRKVGAVPRGGKAGRFARTAKALGIERHRITLVQGGPKLWRAHQTDRWSRVEDAALAHFARLGWDGAAAEGGLMLTLIKAASFPKLPPRHADTFVESIYHWNVALPPYGVSIEWLLSNVAEVDLERLRHNYAVIAATTGNSPAYYPGVRWSHVAGLFERLGRDRLLSVAMLFATAPYDLRAGWPDLTLWRGSDVRFLEVKAPGDQLHASQRRLISTMFAPLRLTAGIVEVVNPAQASTVDGTSLSPLGP